MFTGARYDSSYRLVLLSSVGRSSHFWPAVSCFPLVMSIGWTPVQPRVPVWAVAQSGRKRARWGLQCLHVWYSFDVWRRWHFSPAFPTFLYKQEYRCRHFEFAVCSDQAVLSRPNAHLIYVRSLHPVLSITSNALPLVNADNGEEIDFDDTLWLDCCMPCASPVSPLIVCVCSN